MFWGVELKGGESHTLNTDSKLIISNACLTQGSLKVIMNKCQVASLNEAKPQAKLFIEIINSTKIQVIGQGKLTLCGYTLLGESEIVDNSVPVAQLIQEMNDEQKMNNVYGKVVQNIEQKLRKQNWDEVDWSEMN